MATQKFAAAAATALALVAQPTAAAHLRKPHGESLAVLAMHTYRQDCGRGRPVSLAAAKISHSSERNPGAGTEPNLIEPFVTVLKDGFYEVDCIGDYMFKHGDKFGDNKHEYELGEVSNVSIVHYAAHVAKEDKEEMTHEVCFSFCRTVPDMNFFGITNGRECYCMTYYKAMADDSSMCDAVCDGNPGAMCGGKSKSSVFGMHQCSNTAEQLSTVEGDMSEMDAEMMALEGKVSTASTSMQKGADEYQAMFGSAGDPGASDLMQTAKVFAGELEHAAGAAGKLSETMGSLKTSATTMAGADLTAAATLADAEGLLEEMEAATAQGAAETKALEELLAQATPNATGSENASQQYYPVMYFVNKSFVDVPSTCTGTAAEKPMIGSMDSCAQACDADIHECVGFSYFPPTGAHMEGGLCFLMSKLKTAKYYTGCGGGGSTGSLGGSFLQGQASKAKVDAEAVKCVVKFSKFDGTTLKPNPSGKCDLCLKEAEQADRCFA